MVSFNQIIKIKFNPAFSISKDDTRECLIAIGNYGNNNKFLIKMINNSSPVFQSKKYLKKKDKEAILLTINNYAQEEDLEEVIDLTDLNYVDGMNAIEDKYETMASIY